LSNVDLCVPPATIVGLIGPSCAGKTTMVDVLTGFQPLTEGEIRLDGEALVGHSAVGFRRRGVARTFRGGWLFRDLSVLDTLEASDLSVLEELARVAQSAVTKLAEEVEAAPALDIGTSVQPRAAARPDRWRRVAPSA
jgi:branched-chain amino acid transport system ATP-binding protein